MSCHNCKQNYDLACANLSPKRYKKMSPDGRLNWKCLECRSKEPKADNSNTPVRAVFQTVEEGEDDVEQDRHVTVRRARSVDNYITKEALKGILSEEIETTLTRLGFSQLKNINTQFSEIQESIAYISGQYEDIKKLLNTTSSDLQSLKAENNSLKETLNKLTVRVKTLEEENMKQQQWVRLQNIEITGVPEDKEENTVAIVQKVSEYIGVDIALSDVEFAHRVQPRRAASAVRARPIIARLKQRILKDKIMASARKHRNLNTKEVGIAGEISKIYINEHLTKDNKILLKLCKQKAKELNYKYIWTKNCRIFVRKNEISPPISINSSSDIVKIV